MKTLAQLDSQRQTVRQAAEALGSPDAIDGWIRTCWQFEADPPEYEFIRTPALQLQQAFAGAAGSPIVLKGDCDDASVLAASLLAALHWPCVFVAIRVRPDPDFSHVFVRTPSTLGHYEIDIDPIVPASMLPLTGNFELMKVEV
jgi:hypothetical protein